MPPLPALSETLFIESKNDKTLIEIVTSCNKTRKEQAETPGIIIAHPYGPLGGNMHHFVITAIQQHFLSLGYLTVCINFRGCGKSKGKTSWTGMAERDDYMSVMEYLLADNQLQNYPQVSHLLLCGYSFGAMIANSIQCTKISSAYLLVSLPLGVMWALATTKAYYFKKQQPRADKKALSIHGDNDQFTGLKSFTNWALNHDHITDICIQGADHFWWNHDHELIQHIESWRRKELINWA